MFKASFQTTFTHKPSSEAPLTMQRGPGVYALQDSEILQLLGDLPDSTMGRRYRFAFQLMATYGLKAAELRYLQVRNHDSELWLRARRLNTHTSGESTGPCRLVALRVLNLDGIPQEWNLVGRVALGERLPPLGTDSEADRQLESYLQDKPCWRIIQRNAVQSGQQAVMDSFRQRYACTGRNLRSTDEQL